MIMMIIIIMSFLYYYCAGIAVKRSTTVRSQKLYSNTEITNERR